MEVPPPPSLPPPPEIIEPLPSSSPKPLSPILPPGSQDLDDDVGPDNQLPLPPPQQQLSLPNVAVQNPNFSPDHKLHPQSSSSPPPGFSPAPPSPAPLEPVADNPNLSPNYEQQPQPSISPPPQEEADMNPESKSCVVYAEQNTNLSDNHLEQLRFSYSDQDLEEVNPDSRLDDPIQSPNLSPQLQQSLSPPPGFSTPPSPFPAPHEPDVNAELSQDHQESEQPQLLQPNSLSPLAQFSTSSSPVTLDHDLNPNPTPMVRDQIPDIQTDQEQQLSQLTVPPSSPPQALSPPPPPSPTLVDDPVNTIELNPSPYQSPLRHSPAPSPPRYPDSLHLNPESKSPKKELDQILIPYKSPPQSHFSPPPESSPPTSPPLKSQDPIPNQDSPSQSPSSTPSESISLKNTAIPEPEPIMQVAANMAASPSKKPAPWTHDETTNLIETYQEKWYSLKRGQLKAGQWEEVAITVAARCGYDELSKTATQCRHKIEKLRKRYRDEKRKPRSKAYSWNLFKLMDHMERGPLPISEAQPLTIIEHDDPPQRSGGRSKKKNDSDSEFLAKCNQNKSKSGNPIASGGMRYIIKPGVNQKVEVSGSGRVLRQLRSPVNRKRKNLFDNSDDEVEEEEDNGADAGAEDGGGDGMGQLALQIRSFTEKFVRMENKKIEMMRDTERYRMEMENKRMEMILESQQQLVEMVHKAFNSSSHKKRKLTAK